MASILIRNIDEADKRALQERAKRNGRSMEAEARQILFGNEPEENIVLALMRVANEVGGVELDIPPRNDYGRVVDFE